MAVRITVALPRSRGSRGSRHFRPGAARCGRALPARRSTPSRTGTTSATACSRRTAAATVSFTPSWSTGAGCPTEIRDKLPKLSQRMDEAEIDVLAYKRFPAAHWPKISSTNPIERPNAEIKRRTDVVGVFPNEAAILRLVGAVLMEARDLSRAAKDLVLRPWPPARPLPK